MNLIFFSTDIPNTTQITFSDIQLKVNGNSVSISNYLVTDENTCLRVMLQNIWDTDHGIAELPFYQTPVTDLEITFTVSGFAYDKAADASTDTAAPAADASADTEGGKEAADDTKSDKGGNAGLIVGIIAGVAVIGGGAAFLASKKGKKDGE